MPINKSAGWNDLQIGLFISSLPRTHLTNNLACHQEYHLNRADTLLTLPVFGQEEASKEQNL